MLKFEQKSFLFLQYAQTIMTILEFQGILGIKSRPLPHICCQEEKGRDVG
jgi:hypothetical protein